MLFVIVDVIQKVHFCINFYIATIISHKNYQGILEHHWIVRSRIIIGCHIEINLECKPKVTSFQIAVGV